MIKQEEESLGRCIELRLARELNRLKRVTGLGHHLEVMWRPDEASDRHGEVKGNLIFIYDLAEEDAVRTLKHEFLDYLITDEIIDPLVKQINLQKSLIESLVYERKERIIERFLSLHDR